MVRLINQKNIGIISNFAFSIMKIQEIFTHIELLNHPDLKQCIYVMWHQNQFCVHGLPNRNNVNILISTSLDGEIIARVTQKWGFKVCRGSSGRKGSVSSTLKMIEKLKNGESIAIMVDGPRGPLHKVKTGAIVLSRETGIPIVPVHWYSEDLTFTSLPSWDKMETPFGPCRILNSFAKPIYVENKSDEEVASEIKIALEQLEENEKDSYTYAKKNKFWSRKK